MSLYYQDDPMKLDEFREFMENIGIDEKRDADIMWLVQQAFKEPLPPNWTEHTDDAGRIYFFNNVTQDSVWLHPMDDHYKEALELVKYLRELSQFSNPPSSNDVVRCIEHHLLSVQQNALRALKGWSGPYASRELDANGSPLCFYYYQESNFSSWINPVDEWEYYLHKRYEILSKTLLGIDPNLAQEGERGKELANVETEPCSEAHHSREEVPVSSLPRCSPRGEGGEELGKECEGLPTSYSAPYQAPTREAMKMHESMSERLRLPLHLISNQAAPPGPDTPSGSSHTFFSARSCRSRSTLRLTSRSGGQYPAEYKYSS